MKDEQRLVVHGAAALGAVLLLWLCLTLWLLWSVMGVERQAQLRAVLEPVSATHGGLLAVMLVILLALAAWALRALVAHFVVPPARLAEEALVLLRSGVSRPLPPSGSRENRQLAGVFNQMVEQRERLRHDMDQRVRHASEGVELERSRLAALMAELSQSVVVCNLDGRILLYNRRAREQFRAFSPAPGVADGAELLGLGRSIYGVFDRKLVAHALEKMHQRVLRGVASPAAQFVTAGPGGLLLRVQVAPVRAAQKTPEAGWDGAEDEGIRGFVLMLDNVTGAWDAEAARDHALHTLTERGRSALASVQAAVDMLAYPDLGADMRERFLSVIQDEVKALGQRIVEVEAGAAQQLKSRWSLEDMLGADLVEAAQRRIEIATGLATSAGGVDAAVWLRVESYSLLQVLVYLAQRLVDEFGVRFVELRLGPVATNQNMAQLDLVWSGQAMSTETVMSWELDPMRVGQDTTGLTVRDVVERHGGGFWFERERVRHQAFFRLWLPLASRPEPVSGTSVVHESRPEFYDFDLFQSTEQTRSMDERLLRDLSYTVFDTETTGLEPSAGDEIIQIGAARIVNGKLLRHECFEQLVDPQRRISPATIPVHGIDQEMVAGQPTIDRVLPAFHAFAADTVLVAHNAAFDMRFLQLKEKRVGLVFDQPVLDTLLLSALVHPNQPTHRLEAIAQRFQVTIVGRHTALGDALVTAEVFLKLIPLLAEQGIHTLGQARAAAQKTYYARLKY